MKQKEYEYCLRCGRKLKSHESRMIGYGTICLKKSRETAYSIRLFPVSAEKWLKDDKNVLTFR